MTYSIQTITNSFVICNECGENMKEIKDYLTEKDGYLTFKCKKCKQIVSISHDNLE